MKVKPEKLKDHLREALKLSSGSVHKALFQKEKSDLKKCVCECVWNEITEITEITTREAADSTKPSEKLF